MGIEVTPIYGTYVQLSSCSRGQAVTEQVLPDIFVLQYNQAGINPCSVLSFIHGNQGVHP